MARPTTPLLAADIIIRLQQDSDQRIVLIKRKNPPLGWALPGGGVDVGETVAAAAAREALEETCCRVQLLLLLGCYSDPARDRRGHTVSLVYVATTCDEPCAADDAAECGLFSLDALPKPLCFDHATILKDYKNYLLHGESGPLHR
jgi:8-oxo-dGTP diphosphatase